MAAHAGVVPVGHDERSVGSHADVARPDPAVGRAGGHGRDPRLVAGAAGRDGVGPDHVRPGVAVDHPAAKPLGQKHALVDADPGGRAAAGLQEVGHHAGVVLMPVPERDLGLQVRAARLPAGPAPLVHVAIVAIFHHEVDPHSLVAVVVVVALPERAERVHRHLVVVAEVVAEHLEVGAVGPATEDHALAVGLSTVVDRVAETIHHRLAVTVMDGPAGVAEVEVPAAVGADHEGVHRVVVLGLARLREQDLAAVGHEIPVVVMKDEHLGSARHDHPPPPALADHADAQGAIDIAALMEDRLLVGHAVAV